MTKETLTALMVSPGMHPCSIELYKNYEFLSKAICIGLDIPCAMSTLSLSTSAAIIYNKDAHNNAMQCNRRVGNRIIAGTFYIVGVENGSIASLSCADTALYKANFWESEEFDDDEAIDAWLTELEWEITRN